LEKQENKKRQYDFSLLSLSIIVRKLEQRQSK
jgi:hypothetical protein